MMIVCESFIDVQFFDLDPMNVVWHGNYIKYLEQARCEMLAKIGYTYDDMKADGFAYPIAKMDLKFIKPAQFMQKLKVVTTLVEFEPSLNIKYEIFDMNFGEKIFTNFFIVLAKLTACLQKYCGFPYSRVASNKNK